jgi:cellulose synthase/poly-beta-1,6-N-acetylglucosamine synthase-like glycosyltransferase
MGWTPINAQMIISGAFGLFHKETVVSVGGYRRGAKGEDMELVMLLHKELSRRDKPYRIHFIPDPICWTDVPDTYTALKKQRIHWHKGHMQALAENIRLMFNYKAKAAGLIAFPFSLIFEGIGPVVEFIGYFMIIGGFLSGIISPENFLLFLMVAIGLGILLSTLTLLLEEISFHIYPKSSHVAILFAAAILENFGYRQLNTLWRVQAIVEMSAQGFSSLAKKGRQRLVSRGRAQGRP